MRADLPLARLPSTRMTASGGSPVVGLNFLMLISVVMDVSRFGFMCGSLWLLLVVMAAAAVPSDEALLRSWFAHHVSLIHWRAYEDLEEPLNEDVFDSIRIGMKSETTFYVRSTCKVVSVVTLHEVPTALRYLLPSFDLKSVRVIGIVPVVEPFVQNTSDIVYVDQTLDDEAFFHER